jgi:polar amino acid transport system substrate-binding protein
MTSRCALPRLASPRRALAVLAMLVTLLAAPLAVRAAEVVADARAALPASVRDAGVLKVATSLQWPPFDYKAENGQPDGIDIRLVTLLAGKLGLRPDFTDVKFPAIVPGVANGRFDIGVDQIGVTPERLKAVDFLNYYNSGYGLLVRAGAAGLDASDLCGHTLVLTQGSAQVGLADQLSAACTQAGKKPIAMLNFPDSADTYLALANGRGDGFLSDPAVGAYIARGNPKLTMTTGTLPGHSLISGIVIARGNTALRQALLLALESAVADGSYSKLLDDFSASQGALTLEQIRAPATN